MNGREIAALVLGAVVSGSVVGALYYWSTRNQTNEVRKELANLKAEMALTKDSHDAIGFYAWVVISRNLGHQQAIEFDYVHENSGNGYDSRRGYFIAPVDGLYHFSTTIHSMNHTKTIFGIMKNKVNIIQAHASVPGHSSTSLDTITRLNKGDMVWVCHHATSLGGILDTDGLSSFGGFRIGQ